MSRDIEEIVKQYNFAAEKLGRFLNLDSSTILEVCGGVEDGTAHTTMLKGVFSSPEVEELFDEMIKVSREYQEALKKR